MEGLRALSFSSVVMPGLKGPASPSHAFTPPHEPPSSGSSSPRLAVLIMDLLLLRCESAWATWAPPTGLITALLVAAVLGLLNRHRAAILILPHPARHAGHPGAVHPGHQRGHGALADRLIDGFTVNGFLRALAFSVVQWLVQGFSTPWTAVKAGEV